MEEEYMVMENWVNDNISIRDYIERLDPEVLEMILEEHGDIDRFLSSLRDSEYSKEVFECIADATRHEQKVILLRAGYISGHRKTAEEVAEIMGVTKERIIQIERKIFRRNGVRHPSRSIKLKEFLKDD